ncbi:hypothetical protein SRHO_G00345190 [Serrasalmus rhombeus]
MLKLCSEVEFFRSTLNGATPGTRSLRPGEPGKLRKMCPERDASALSGFIPPWERQRFNTHSFRQQNSELCAGAALRGTTRTAGTCLRLLSNGGGGGAHCDRSCGNGISLKHKTWSLSPSVQSVSVMKATLLVLLLSAVAVMLSCDHQHSEREAGPGCPLGKRLAFDVNTTIEESKRLNNEYFDCPNPEPGAPCFYYSHDFFILLMTLLDFVLSLVQSGGGFSSRQASTLFRVFKTLKGARVFRALRLLKAIRFFKGLQDILLTCLQSFRSMSSILVLMFLFLFIFAVVFREMFNESDPEHFGSIFRTVFTLFQILTLDDWSLIYMTSRDNGAPHIIYFMSLYILVELFTFLNLFIAVLVDNFQLSIRKKRHHKSQKSPDVKEGEAQSTKKAGEDLDVSLAEIEEEFYKEALRHASSDGKHSKR